MGSDILDSLLCRKFSLKDKIRGWFKIMYLILNEEYEEALELSKKVTSQQKDIGYVMRLYYRIICLEHLEKENELNDCINEMVEFNDQIHYVKEIKDKYKK